MRIDGRNLLPAAGREHADDIILVNPFGLAIEDIALATHVYRFALAHRDIVQRFGRFPHRNAALGRMSTPEEIEFLKQPGSSF